MIKIESLSSNLLDIPFIILCLPLSIAFLYSTCKLINTYYDYDDRVYTKNRNIMVASAVMLICCVVFIPIFSKNETKTAVESISQQIKDYYSIEADYGSLKEAYESLSENSSEPSSVIYAKTLSSSDKRVYEVYLIKDNDGSYVVCTRNEKGVYLPLTGASEEELKKDHSNGVIEEVG